MFSNVSVAIVFLMSRKDMLPLSQELVELMLLFIHSGGHSGVERWSACLPPDQQGKKPKINVSARNPQHVHVVNET